MPKTYRVTSETINFSLVVPDHMSCEEVRAEVLQVGSHIAEQQAKVLQSGLWTRTLERVNEEEEEEDAPTMLGHLVADYYRNT
jgi:hypothetical protein